MVVFTCNHCGESLQKPRVEKHYNIQCRRPKSLTCVDCFKDFKNEEYTVHTKCITEEERYSAKGSIPGGIVKKGDVKQESWTDMIRSIVQSEENMKPSLKNLFNTISNYSNVPRKKAKFINFLKSSTGGRVNFSDIEAAWDLIEKYKNEQKNGNLQNEQVAGDLTENGEESKKNGIIHKTDDTKVKKNKKIKGEHQVDTEVNEEITENGTKHKIDDSDEMPVKKKKKVKQESQLEIEVNEDIKENGKQHHKIDDDKLMPVKKKKKVKQEPQVQNEVKEEVEENETKHKIKDNEMMPVKKKKKVKQEPEVETEVNEDIVENGIQQQIDNHKEMPVKKKKKGKQEPQVDTEVKEAVKENEIKHKINDNEAMPVKKKKKVKQESQVETAVKNETTENGSKCANDDDELSVKMNKEVKAKLQVEAEVKDESNKFNFNETILNILNSKGSISYKKLQKKVLGAYLKETGNTEYTEKTIKKYNKKLEKLRNVAVQDDIVSLVTNSEQ